MKSIYAVFYFYTKIKLTIRKIFLKDPVFLVGAPIHGNLGDQAILESEISLLKDMGFKNIVLIESSFARENCDFLKKYIGDGSILCHGGGNLGTVWPKHEIMFRNVLKTFPNNQIMVFPQTIYFDKNQPEMLESSRKIYSSHKHLTIFCREKFSYEFATKYFKKLNVVLVPDIVLYNHPTSLKKKRKNKCLLCLRQDREKVFSEEVGLSIVDILRKKNINFEYTDTVLKTPIFTINRKFLINKKLKQFSSASFVITDRLHGMVFAYLTKTPCIVFENMTYKVKGLHEWIEKCKYITLCKDSTNIDRAINYVLDLNDESFSGIDLDKQFDPLRNEIARILK